MWQPNASRLLDVPSLQLSTRSTVYSHRIIAIPSGILWGRTLDLNLNRVVVTTWASPIFTNASATEETESTTRDKRTAWFRKSVQESHNYVVNVASGT